MSQEPPQTSTRSAVYIQSGKITNAVNSEIKRGETKKIYNKDVCKFHRPIAFKLHRSSKGRAIVHGGNHYHGIETVVNDSTGGQGSSPSPFTTGGQTGASSPQPFASGSHHGSGTVVPHSTYHQMPGVPPPGPPPPLPPNVVLGEDGRYYVLLPQPVVRSGAMVQEYSMPLPLNVIPMAMPSHGAAGMVGGASINAAGEATVTFYQISSTPQQSST